ncbi:MAG: hypothetical protein ACTSVV_03400 [Promethearchaeota archaeon]
MELDPEILKYIEKIVEEKVEKRLEKVQLSILKKEFLTREEFLEAINKLDKRFEELLIQMKIGFEEARKERELIQKEIDKRLEEARKDRELIREEMDKRFNSLIEQMNKGFEEARKDRELIREEMDKRFEEARKESDKRFKALLKQMDDRFEALIKDMNEKFKIASEEREILKAFTAKLSSRRGIQLENAVLYLLKDKLIKESINVSDIKKEYLTDDNGAVFVKGFMTDIDVVIRDGKIILIEIKTTADNRDVNDLIKKAELFKIMFKKDYDELMILCLEINETNYEFARRHNVNVIAGEIV